MISSNPWIARKANGRGLVSLRVTQPGFAICTKCLEEKPDECYGAKKRSESGDIVKRASVCKVCEAASARAYRAAHKEKLSEWHKARHARIKDARNERLRLHRLQNPELYREQDKRYYARYRDRVFNAGMASFTSLRRRRFWHVGGWRVWWRMRS
jgi:hypothetical protein